MILSASSGQHLASQVESVCFTVEPSFERLELGTMNRLHRASARFTLLTPALAFAVTTAVAATPPNPLESAYWRFEEGSHNAFVNAAIADPVKDSLGNDDHLDAFNAAAAPTYSNLVPPTPLKSTLPNTLSLDFIRQLGGNDDLFTLFTDGDHGKGLAKDINNGIIAPGGGITVEGAFNTTSLLEFQAIIAKEGRPGLGRGLGFIENLPTFAVKTRPPGDAGDFRQGRLQMEMWDGAGNITDIVSNNPLVTDQWYYFAVVSDGSTVELWLDSNDGMGYLLQGTPNPISGALYQGPDPNNPSWDNSWVVGRAQFGGGVADFFDGRIDEVRISNTALSPAQFLFAPPGEELIGDYNEDGTVDAADYVVWRKSNINGENGYSDWRENFGETGSPGSGGASGAVPEPASFVLCLFAIALLAIGRRRKLIAE